MPNQELEQAPIRDIDECRPTECEEKPRARMDMLRNHEINIQFFSVGCLIRVGCKTIAFNSVEIAMNELNMYVADPNESVIKWNKVFNVNE